MNPFKYRYNLTDVNTGMTFPVDLTLTKGSWIKIIAWSVAPFVVLTVAAQLAQTASETNSNTEDTTSDFPQYS